MSPIFYIILIIGLFTVFTVFIIRQIRHSRHRKKTDEQINKGEHDAAIRNLQELIRNDPDDLRSRFGLGKLQIKAGKGIDAIATLKLLLDRNLQGSGVSHIDAVLLLADAYETAGNSDEAYKHIMIAKGLDQTNPEVNLKLAAYENQRGSFQEAFSHAGMVLRLNPSHKEALLQRGLAAVSLGSMDTALESLEYLLKLDSSSFEAAFALTRIHSKSGRPRECDAYGAMAQKLAKNAEQRAQIGFLMGTAHYSARDPEGAMKKLEEALRETGDREMRKKALLLMMTIAEAKKDLNHTLTIIKRYLKFDPANPMVNEKLAYYQELAANKGLQQFEMLPASRFDEFCRELARAITRIDHIQSCITNKDGSVDILANLTTKKEHIVYQFRFIRSNSPIGEMFVRDLYEKMRANSGEKAFMVSNSSYTEGALNFSNTRVINLIDRDKLTTFLKRVKK